MNYYHGSRSFFKEFSVPGNGKHGEGFYFTLDKNEAEYFAKTLYGTGQDKTPTLYTVKIKVSNSFDTMNSEHCQKVMSFFGHTFKPNKNARGAKEQYYYLERQLKNWGIPDVNLAIKSAGFDSIFWDFGGHLIVFNPSLIEIIEISPVDF